MADILIVEEDEAIRKLVHKVLSDMGHTIHEAANGVSAIRLCRHYKFDLIIMDYPMPPMLLPAMNSLEVARQPGSDPATGIPPFILHTSDYDNQELRNIALNAGALGVIEKIGNIKAFRQAINHFLEKIK